MINMPTDITINNITGNSPYDIYVCDDPISVCIYIITTNSFPYSFQVPTILSSQTSVNLKIVDNFGCVNYENLTI